MKVPKTDVSINGMRNLLSFKSPIIWSSPGFKDTYRIETKKQIRADNKIEVKVTAIGELRFVTTSVAIICPANIKAHKTVNHSSKSKCNSGGPWIYPAPKVANKTPKSMVNVGTYFFQTTTINAVKITYRLVKNADTAGVIPSSPII